MEEYTLPETRTRHIPWARIGIIAVIAVVVAGLTVGVAVQTSALNRTKEDLSASELHSTNLSSELDQAHEDLTSARSENTRISSELLDVRSQLGVCQDGIEDMRVMALHVGKAALNYVKAAAAGLFSKLGFLTAGNSEMKIANGMMDHVTTQYRSCTAGGGSFSL